MGKSPVFLLNYMKCRTKEVASRLILSGIFYFIQAVFFVGKFRASLFIEKNRL